MQGDKLATAEAMVKLCREQVYKSDPQFEGKEAAKILARLCVRTVVEIPVEQVEQLDNAKVWSLQGFFLNFFVVV